MADDNKGQGAGAAGAGAGDEDQNKGQAAAGKEAGAAEGKAGSQKPEDKSVLDAAGAEEKAAKDAEEKRLLEAKEEDLNDADKAKRADLVKAKDAAEKASQVPDKYEFKVPEGFTLDQGFVDKITPVLKDAKISQGDAQKLADVYVEQLKGYKQDEKNNFDSYVSGLKKECQEKLSKEELAFAAKARDRFVSKELLEKLNTSGFANDIELVRLFITIGKSISEDKLIEGDKAGNKGTQAPEKTLYDKTPEKK